MDKSIQQIGASQPQFPLPRSLYDTVRDARLAIVDLMVTGRTSVPIKPLMQEMDEFLRSERK